MIVNLKSTREMKPNNLNKGKILLNSAKLTSLNSRNQSNTKYTKTTKIIKSNNSKEKINKTKKTIVNNKNLKISQKKILLKAEKKMFSNLKKYNMTIESYNKKVITDIIYDERKHIVSVFKNYLLWDEMSDFLKRFYYKHESKNRLPKINHYYEKYTLFPPVYFPLEDVIKIMLKNVKRKKKYLEMIEENEDNMYNNNNKKKENKEFKRIINPSDISQTMSLKTYKNNTLTNTISSLNYENENNSKDLGQLINKFIDEGDISYFNDTFLKNKNNSHEIIQNTLDIHTSIFKIDDSEIEKKDYKVDNENLEQKIDKNNKTKIPMTGKVLEIKKLNFEKINENNNNENLDSNNKNVKTKEKIKIINNSDRQKISNYYSLSNLTNVKSSNIKKKLNKNKYTFANNLLFTQKLLSTTRDSKKTITNEKTNKSLESLLKIIQYPKQLSPRAKTNSNTQNKVIKHKRKTNLVIQTNSNKNTISSRINTSNNKKDIKSNTENNSKKKNINNNIITPKFITNNNITSKIYNINLNLNIGNNKKKNLTQNPNSNFNKKQCKNIKNKYNNIRNILYGNSSIPISNNPNSQFSNLFKTKNLNIEQKKNPESKRKDGKISYDLNSNGNNVHISIHKQTSSNTNNNNNSNSNTQPSVNININCQNNNNNLIEKKVSRNEKNVLSNLQSNSIKGKHLVIQLCENNTSIKKKNKTKKTYNIYGNDLINALCHDTSMNIGKLKKKLNIQIKKKYPLTSRNEKDIPYNIINKLLSKLK